MTSSLFCDIKMLTSVMSMLGSLPHGTGAMQLEREGTTVTMIIENGHFGQDLCAKRRKSTMQCMISSQ